MGVAGVMFPFILLVAFFAIPKASAQLHICARSSDFEVCQQIGRSKDVQCNKYYNNIDCMLSLSNGTSDFGRVSPDEAILGSRLLNNLNVIGEVRRKEGENRSSEFEMVVLVKDHKIKGFGDLQGRRLCHPGFGKLLLPRHMLTQFEEVLIDTYKPRTCSSKVNTTLERHIAALSQFLGPSCRPGPWTEDEEFDKLLKSRYPNLCMFCNKGCSGDDIFEPFSESLDCLDRGGDIAITTNTELARRNWTLSIFLCPDGSVSARMCPWAKRAWPLILANDISKAPSMIYLKEIFGRVGTPIQSKDNIDQFINRIIKPEATDKVLFFDVALKAYVENLHAAPEKPRCDQKLRWCVVSEDELQKCRWLDEASVAQGIYLNIECLMADSRLQCINMIAKNQADIAAINSNLGYAARRKFLKPVAFPETYTDDLSKTLVVVKNSFTGSFISLKGQKGCFAEYGDIAFMSFMARIKSPLICDYGIVTNYFMGESCIPGANDPLKEATTITNVAKLCTICSPADPNRAITCNANYENEYFGNSGALKCLKEVGDYAVITTKNITEYIDYNDFRVLCKNGTLATIEGLKVDEGCYLSVTTSSEVVVRKDFELFEDTALTLAAFDKVFGQDLHKPFELFNKFNNIPNLLFLDTTPGITFDPQENENTKDYVKIFADYDSCIEKGDNGAQSMVFSWVLAFVPICMILAFF